MESKSEPLKGSYRKVNDQIPELLQKFPEAHAYRTTETVKTVWPEHRQAVYVNPDGKEREVIANWGDRIITYKNGHSELIAGSEVNQRLRPTMDRDIYEVDVWVKAVENKFNQGISIIAPPGGFQLGESDCRIAVRYFPETGAFATTPFIISNEDFASYKEVVPIEQKEPIAA